MSSRNKSNYTQKEKRQAKHVEKSYEAQDVPKKEAEKRGWATVNKYTHASKSKNKR